MERPVIVNPPELPELVGYAHAVVAGGAVYLGGQIEAVQRSSSSSTRPQRRS